MKNNNSKILPFTTGLVSVSFRRETPETIILSAAEAGLGGIEWGGDIHVPPGDFANARRVGELTRAAGLTVCAYGSYYKLGLMENPEEEFKSVLEAAAALGAPAVRIWAGDAGSEQTPPERRAGMSAEAARLCRLANSYGIDVALECHGGTLTDYWRSSLDFLGEADHPRLKMYWQPNQRRDHAYNLEAAEKLAPHTLNIHVFHWIADKKLPLAEGETEWRAYFDIFRKTGREHALLLEFMHDGRLESLPETAETLRRFLCIIN